jgi:hypothetical protein
MTDKEPRTTFEKIAETLARLNALPEALKPHNRRYFVEAVSDETRAPMIEYYRQKEAAEEAAQEWAKAHGAVGFYPPHAGTVSALSFAVKDAPTDSAWVDAGRGYVERHGYVAKRLSKRPAGKALAAELAALPDFPDYGPAIKHLGAVTDLSTERGSSGVGHSDGKFHFAAPFELSGRYFIHGVNHNYDIFQMAERAGEYLGGENPEWAPSLDFKGDPISWRPGDGWALLSKAELEFLIAEENLRRAKLRASEAAAEAAEAGQ